jgi:ATP-dependent protease ClpP protease subunit
MDRNWYSIKAQAEGDSDSADVYIFDYIGGWEITARSFIEELKALRVGQINLHINSPGGYVFDGIAIQNSLKHHPANVTVYIDGLAASIASIIALAGDDLRIADNAYVMIHNPASIIWGDAKDMLKEAEVLSKIADGLAGDYSRKMDISLEEARALMDEETWYLGQEAVEAGFADSTFEGARAAASFDLNRIAAKAPAEALARFSQPAPRTTSPAHDFKEAAVMPKPKDPKNDRAETPAPEGAETPTEKVEAAVPAPAEETPVDVNAAVEAALAAERTRTAEINTLSAKFGFADDAEDFLTDGKSAEDFRAHILSKSPDDWRASLAIKNPTTQPSETDEGDSSEGSEAVAKIKERRKARFSVN